MTPHCHRCDAEVGSEDAFCANCGAPQLRFLTDDGSELPGAQREPGSMTGGDIRGVDWKKAFRAALSIALPMGVLTALPGISLGFVLWVTGGAMLAVSLYRRRRPGALLDARSGFRIGALTGLLAAYISAALVATLQLLARYKFHLGAAMDNDYAQREEQSMHWTYQMVQSSADTEAQMRAWLHFFLSPDGRAAMSLVGAGTTAVLTVLLAGLGGLLGVRMFARRAA